MRIYPLLFFLFLFITHHFLSAQEMTAPDLEEEYARGMASFNDYQYEKAKDHFYECYRTDPQNLDYLSKLSYSFYQIGNYRDAKLHYNIILKLDSLNINAITTLGQIYEKEQNYKKALVEYEKLLNIDTTNAYYFRQIAFCTLKNKDAQQAIHYFNKAYELNSSDVIVINQLANLYLNAEAIDYAVIFADRGIKEDSSNLKLLYTHAKIKTSQKDFPAVIESIEKAMAQGDTLIYYEKLLSHALFKVDSFDLALFHLNRIVERHKDTEHTHHTLGLVYWQKNEVQKSIEHMEIAIDRAISSQTTLYYKDLGMICEEDKKHKKAYHAYKEAYRYSNISNFLFYQAKNADHYFKDKKIALRLYQKYLDSDSAKYQKYAQYRVAQLKELIHFQN